MRVRLWAATLVVIVLWIAGCAAVPGSSPAPETPSSTRAPATAWETEMGNLQPDGSRSLGSALRLFSMAFGPLPGVERPAGDVGEILSGSPAVRALNALRAELTPEQQAAVDDHLRVPDDAVLEHVPPAAAASPAAVRPLAAGFVAADVDPAFVTEVHRELAYLRGRLAGHWGDFPNDIALYIIPSQTTGAYTWYDADVPPLNLDQFACRVFVTGNGMAASPEALHVSLAHEVFFCGATYKIGSKLPASLTPAWAWEGSAHYFAMEATSASFRNAWERYFLEAASIPLFEREYDAIGFWSHIQYRSGGVYAAMAAALAQGNNEERFVAAGGSTNDFLNTWASGLFRDALLRQGRDWNTDGPGLSPVLSTPRQVIHVANDDVELVEQAAYTNTLYVVEASADLLRFEFVGRARLGDAETVDTTELGSAIYCLRAGGCPPCPNDPDPQQYPTLANFAILAISGGMDGTTGSVSGEKLPPCTSPPPSACPDQGAAPAAGADQRLAMTGAIRLAAECPTPEPTNDEFCLRYRAYWSWAQSAGDDVTRAKSAEIERRFIDMRPYAPAHLAEYVELMIEIYGTFARAPDPVQVPLTGQLPLHRIPEALHAMHAHCGMPSPF